MRELSLIVALLVTMFNLPSSDSPHGKDFDLSCSDCHNSEGWTIDRNNISFNHDMTNFQLEGSHEDVNCVSCHPTLVFSEAEPQCMSCHVDMHQQTVGFECQRCHTTSTWIVTNITEIHQQSRFPLLGAHITADCYDCHQSGSLLLFEPLGVECVDCHLSDYQSATNPSHIENNYSTECMDCHQMNAFTWTGANFTHNLFPLTLGHANVSCNQCHTGTDYSNISPECFSCHQSDYNATTSPNHQQADLTTECTECHTTNPGWKPADFTQHDNVFPIYTGEHRGEWGDCVDCHKDPGNYASFTCIDCHEHNKNEMDDEHSGISGYIYSSVACLECHPTGSEEGSFNHATSNFPLTGAHIDTECAQCHVSGYSGTPIDCFQCHMPDFNQTTNPNHVEIELTDDCASCHTTDPGWQPALFDIHNEYYVLTGAHLTTICADCHTNGYVETPNICFDCHTTDFNQTTDPNHIELGFPNDCEECHTTAPDWKPTTYNHDEIYPLTGAHSTALCISCHESGYVGTPNTCFECHETNYNQTTNPNHVNAALSNNCDECHTTNPGWTPATFNNHNDFYVLEGAHALIANDCYVCHNGNYNNTPNTCVGCHLDDYNQTSDPPHASAQFSTDCLICHSQVAWEPSTFNHDIQYFPIYSGKHEGEWNQCSECHPTPTNYEVFSCIDCHEHNKTDMDDEHNGVSGYIYASEACLDCHPDGDSKFVKPRIQYRIR